MRSMLLVCGLEEIMEELLESEISGSNELETLRGRAVVNSGGNSAEVFRLMSL